MRDRIKAAGVFRRGHDVVHAGTSGKEETVENQERGPEPRDISRIEELLNQEHYTPAEAAEVLNMGQRTILSAAYGGELRATMVGHDIVSISRSDLVDWIRRREM